VAEKTTKQSAFSSKPRWHASTFLSSCIYFFLFVHIQKKNPSMLRNNDAPYANAWEALKCKESSRARARVPNWANPYAMPLVRNECCPPNPRAPTGPSDFNRGHPALYKFW
jgi:hypothetical protein